MAKLPHIATMRLDANRPMLEQLEEEAAKDGQALEWLQKNVYDHPERLSILTPIRLPHSTEPSGSQQA